MKMVSKPPARRPVVPRFKVPTPLPRKRALFPVATSGTSRCAPPILEPQTSQLSITYMPYARRALTGRLVISRIGWRNPLEAEAVVVSELFAMLTPPDASVEDQLRVRIALLIINMTGMAARDLDAGEEDILDAAARISTGLLSPGF